MKKKSKVKDDRKLLNSIKKDRKNFAKLYELYYSRILNFIHSRVSTRSLAEDLTGEIFEKALKSIEDFKWQGISLSSWLYRIARNRLTDHYRKMGKIGKDISLGDVEHFLEDEEVSLYNDVVRDEEEKVLYNAIREFREEDQFLLYYKFFENLSNKEISKLTGFAESNVGTRLYRIRKKLKEYLKKEGIYI